MRVGIVSKWFASGQAVVSRQLRSALDELGHETFILARPGKGPRQRADRTADEVWDQDGVTAASDADVPLTEYEAWAEHSHLEAIVCDQNYQFDEIASLRRRGIRTIGRFVWEHFTREHVTGALEAYDVIYSLTRCERERYRSFGIESPYVQWGIHPELLEVAEGVGEREGSGEVRLVLPGSFMGKRKPFAEIVDAFSRVDDARLRLLVRGQVQRKVKALAEAAERDPRIEILLADQPMAEHLATFAACDVCLSPSRWEGLGLPLYEAVAFGMPTITNDVPPMNEIVEHERNGLLVRSHQSGTARSGIPAYDPDVDDLARQIERIADDRERERLARGALEVRSERSWARTVEGIGGLVELAAASPVEGAGG